MWFAGKAGMKFLFCLNPHAGRRRGPGIAQLVEERFAGLEHDHRMVELGRDMRWKDEIATYSPDRVVAVGGDGTVVRVAGVVGGTRIPMAIIPTGSANGLATDLGIPSDPGAALDLAISGEHSPIDAILINDRHLCLHLSDLGMNARLIKYFDETGARGMHVYARLSLKVLLRSERFHVRVCTAEGEVRRHAFMVVIANARKYGTGATINKVGAINDGAFELVLVRRFGLRELWASLGARRRFDPERIEVFQATESEIFTSRPAHFQVDGDHHGKVSKVHARILPGHVRLIHPATAPSLDQ